MPRFTMTLSNEVYNTAETLAEKHKDSISGILNQFIELGMTYFKQNRAEKHVMQYCCQLDIQTNAIMKNMAMHFLKMTTDDFERLKEAAAKRYQELLQEA